MLCAFKEVHLLCQNYIYHQARYTDITHLMWDTYFQQQQPGWHVKNAPLF